MSGSIRTITYDRVPITLVHPSLAQDMTLLYLLLPVDAAERRVVLQQSLPWLKTFRRWFDIGDTVVLQVDTFLRELSWQTLNHIQIDTDRCWDWRTIKMNDVQSSDYDLRILFSLLPRSLSDEEFGTALCLSLM